MGIADDERMDSNLQRANNENRKLTIKLNKAMAYLGEVLDMVHGTTPVDRDRLDEIQEWFEK
jgi:hypothetical protein